jgi:hypothetical protein
MKKYRDYGEYLEDAYEQQMLAAMRKHGDTYIYGNRKLTIIEKNGELTAEWETI